MIRADYSIVLVVMRKTEKTMKEEFKPQPVRAKEMMLDLCSARFVLTHFQLEGRLYKGIVSELLNVGEDDPIPTSKKLQARLNLSANQLSKQLQELYEDFWSILHDGPMLIRPKEVIHIYHAKGYDDRYASFQCQLPVTPRIGERVTFPFLRGKTGTDFYHVSDIEYVYADDTLIINISLRTGSFNHYFTFSKDRLELENKVGMRDFINLNDYQIGKLIRETYSK